MATCPGRGSVHREPPSATRPCRALQCRKREVGALAADRAHRCRWRLWSRWHAQQQPADALPVPHQARAYDAGSRLTPQTIQPTARHCARSARRAADLDRQGMWSARCQLPVDSGHVRCVERDGSRRCSLTLSMPVIAAVRSSTVMRADLSHALEMCGRSPCVRQTS